MSWWEVSYLGVFGDKSDADISWGIFSEAKLMAAKAFEKVLEEIMAETESWQQDLESAMTSLRQRIETTTQEAREAVETAVTKVAADEQAKKQKEEEEKQKKKPVIFNVSVAASDDRRIPLSLIAIDENGDIKKKFADATPGRTYPFILPPGPYTFRLLDSTDKELDAVAKRLMPQKDDNLSI